MPTRNASRRWTSVCLPGSPGPRPDSDRPGTISPRLTSMFAEPPWLLRRSENLTPVTPLSVSASARWHLSCLGQSARFVQSGQATGLRALTEQAEACSATCGEDQALLGIDQVPTQLCSRVSSTNRRPVSCSRTRTTSALSLSSDGSLTPYPGITSMAALDHRPHLRTPGLHGAELLEGRRGGVGEDPGERRLARPRRPVQDHRVDVAGLDRGPQGRALPQQVGLPHEALERMRAHTRGQRGRRAGPRRRGSLIYSLAASFRVEQGIHVSVDCSRKRFVGPTSVGRWLLSTVE